MTESNRQYAYLSFTGSFDPADITARLGVQPTETWCAGDLNPRNQRERSFSAWHLRSRLPEDSDLEAHVKDVLEQTVSGASVVEQLAREYGGCMQLVGYFHAEYPGLHFEREMVAELSARGLSVDFDLYYLYSDRRETTS